MSDMPINTSSFDNAYRAYAVEQGADIGQATQKAADTATANAASNPDSSAVLEEVEVSISPEAARLYAEDVKRRDTVTKTKAKSEAGDTGSATARNGLAASSQTSEPAMSAEASEEVGIFETSNETSMSRRASKSSGAADAAARFAAGFKSPSSNRSKPLPRRSKFKR